MYAAKGATRHAMAATGAEVALPAPVVVSAPAGFAGVAELADAVSASESDAVPGAVSARESGDVSGDVSG